MLLLTVCVSGSALGQIKVNPHEPFISGESGWFLTDGELLEVDKAIRELALVEERSAYADSIISLQERSISRYRDLLDESTELIEELSKTKDPGLLRQATDQGTLLIFTILGVIAIANQN